MPILVKDSDEEAQKQFTLLDSKDLPLPQLSSESYIVADLSSGNVLLSKDSENLLPIASITKLMSAVVASELIYLERKVIISPAMLKDNFQSYEFYSGDQFSAFELFYPMLMQSSNGASEAIASISGRNTFIANMNSKARSLGMTSTRFADASGVAEENLSTAKDLIKLANYILEKRNFIFSITKGQSFDFWGPVRFNNLKNYNEFASSTSLIGMKNGETLAAKETMLSIWNLKDNQNINHKIAIVILASESRFDDAQKLINWTLENYNFNKEE